MKTITVTRQRLAVTTIALIAVIGVVAWFAFSQERIDAQTVIGNACEDAERVSSGIISMSGTDTRNGQTQNIDWEVRFGDGNKSWHIEYEQLGMRAEVYFVGDTVYNREDESPGVWGEWATSTISMSTSGSGPGATGPVGPVGSVDDSPGSFCGVEGLIDFEYTGVQSVGGEDVKHFSAATDADLLGAGDSVDWEFWIDDSGQMKQFRIDESYVSAMGEPELDIEVVGTVSRLGEPITITAPIN